MWSCTPYFHIKSGVILRKFTIQKYKKMVNCTKNNSEMYVFYGPDANYLVLCYAGSRPDRDVDSLRMKAVTET
jgi:hypothetical protein